MLSWISEEVKIRKYFKRLSWRCVSFNSNWLEAFIYYWVFHEKKNHSSTHITKNVSHRDMWKRTLEHSHANRPV